MASNSQDIHEPSHQEAEQNEIAQPVLFALVCVVIAVLIIYFWAK